MGGKVTFTILDNSNESSGVGYHLPTLDATNIAEWTDDSPTGLLGQLRVLISALTIGNHKQRVVTAAVIPDGDVVPPADPYAQRERKALVTMLDSVNGKYFRHEIPCFGAVGVEPGTDIIDKDAVAWAAYIAFIEANCLSPYGNAFTVSNVKHVGRSI